jgi:hypothetical protein
LSAKTCPIFSIVSKGNLTKHKKPVGISKNVMPGKVAIMFFETPWAFWSF